MRIEILKYLSNTHEFKPLNDLLKKLDKANDIWAIISELKDMGDVIQIKGDFQFLGVQFAELKDIGKVLASIESKPPRNIQILSRGTGNLDNCLISARILNEGRKELHDYELNHSVKSVNESVIKTNRVTLWVAILAAVFSFSSLVISVISIGKSLQVQVEELKETNRLLRLQLQSTEVSLLRSNDTAAYRHLADSMNLLHKDSVDKR